MAVIVASAGPIFVLLPPAAAPPITRHRTRQLAGVQAHCLAPGQLLETWPRRRRAATLSPIACQCYQAAGSVAEKPCSQQTWSSERDLSMLDEQQPEQQPVAELQQPMQRTRRRAPPQQPPSSTQAERGAAVLPTASYNTLQQQQPMQSTKRRAIRQQAASGMQPVAAPAGGPGERLHSPRPPSHPVQQQQEQQPMRRTGRRAARQQASSGPRPVGGPQPPPSSLHPQPQGQQGPHQQEVPHHQHPQQQGQQGPHQQGVLHHQHTQQHQTKQHRSSQQGAPHHQHAQQHQTKQHRPSQQRAHRQRTQQPKAQQQETAAAPLTPPEIITHSIMAAYRLGHLKQVLSHYREQLSPIHLGAMLQRAVEFADKEPGTWFNPRKPGRRQPGELLPQHTQAGLVRQSAAVHRAPGAWSAYAGSTETDGFMSPTRMSDWGMGEDGSSSSGGSLDGGRPRRARQQQQPQARNRPPDPEPDSPSVTFELDEYNTYMAFALLRSLIHRVVSRVAKWALRQGKLDSVAASLILHHLAKLGYPNHKMLQVLLQASISQLPQAGLPALTSMVWSCAMLKIDPGEAWFAAWEEGLGPRISACPAQELCTCMYSMGVLQHRPSPVLLRAACNRIQLLHHMCRPQDLANFCAGLAGMRHVPSDSWVGGLLAATTPRLRTFRLSQLHRMIAGLAVLGIKPETDWLFAFYARCRDLLDSEDGSTGLILTTRSIAGMTTALAQLGCRPDMRWMDACLMCSKRGLAEGSPDQLTQLLAALAALRYRPSDAWIQVFLTASFRHLGSYSPVQVVSQLQSLSRLGRRPPGLWLQELNSKVQVRLQQYTGEQLAELLGAFARLRCPPSPSWLLLWEVASQPKLLDCSAGALASGLWALAQLRHQPATSWLYSYMLAAYGRLDAFDASQLALMFDALPRVSPHPGWLDELVQICANESIPRPPISSSSSNSDSQDSHDSAQQGVEEEGTNALADAPRRGLWGLAWQNADAETSDPATRGDSPAPLRVYGLMGAADDLQQRPLVSSGQAGSSQLTVTWPAGGKMSFSGRPPTAPRSNSTAAGPAEVSSSEKVKLAFASLHQSGV